MRVLHVIWNLGQGGAQTYLRDLAKACVALDDLSLTVLVLNNRGPLSEEIEALGIPTIHLNIRNGCDLRGFVKLFSYLRKSEFDIIHSHSSNVLFNSVLWVSGTPKVFTEHGGGLMGGVWKYKLVYKLFHRNYCRFLAISRASANYMQAANAQIGSKMRVVYNGLDLQAVNATTAHSGVGLPKEIMEAKYRIGIVGRLVPQKGIAMFLETAAVLGKSEDNVVFVVVGDGPIRRELLIQTENLGITKKVFFLGYRKDAKRVFKLFDVFLFTSEWEPFGLVIIEAMALGIPVVALNQNGAVDEILRDGIDGIVVAEKQPSVLARSVIMLLNDSRLRKRMVKNAYERVEKNFTIEGNARQLLEVYNDCLSV